MDTSFLKAKLLAQTEPPTSASAKVIDFAKTPLAYYYSNPNLYALVIDDLFTPEECDDLLQYVTLTGEGWQEALINTGFGRQSLVKGVRDCTRIMIDYFDMAGWIFDRVKPYLDDVAEVGKGTKWDHLAGYNDKWRMTRLNERLRFLRYTKDQYFKSHCDGSYVTPDGKERSYLTLHLYLNSSGHQAGDLGGGSTRFLPPDWTSDNWVDVGAKRGRVLVFQHSRLVHSGEEVTFGVKYTMRTDIIYHLDPGDTPEGIPENQEGKVVARGGRNF